MIHYLELQTSLCGIAYKLIRTLRVSIVCGNQKGPRRKRSKFVERLEFPLRHSCFSQVSLVEGLGLANISSVLQTARCLYLYTDYSETLSKSRKYMLLVPCCN